jgi:rhodanese-related sulfurtransferase
LTKTIIFVIFVGINESYTFIFLGRIYMKLITTLTSIALAASIASAAQFHDYKAVATSLKNDHKKAGTFATAEQVKHALKSKDWVVADVRTKEEWAAAQIKGSVRVGREAPEKALANFVLDDDDKFVKDKLIVVCNSGSRASIEAETFKRMGFSKVMIYDLYSWIDECNPVKTNYTVKKDKKGKGLKFGMYKAEHCK